ncbi:hypothetical protein evm_006500 [Chilo suppressalis]|nr:hypothetical protein evm_006500 [Chilo suppressalis]
MPILIKDFTWSQTPKTVHIKVPVREVKHEKVDIFTTDSYIKANYKPFLFEVFLLYDVDNSKSKCIVKEDIIIFDLVKKDDHEWDSLEKQLSKVEKLELKEEILEKCQEKAKQESEDKRIRKSQLDRFTVEKAMELDNIQHNLMDSRRDEQRKKAMDALEEWRIEHANEFDANDMSEPKHLVSSNNRMSSNVKIIELPSSDEESDKTTKEKSKSKTVVKANPKEVEVPRRSVKKIVKSDYVDRKRKEVNARVLPELRQTAELEVKHTPRSFPTPSRESTASEEEAWIKNITLARRATGFVSEDLRPEEQDPQWCKEKGDEFFRSGNFLGAISAYTHGIMLSDKLPSLFANRAATHFALGNFNKCLNDCSTALELMVPACEGNRQSRGKCIARRAAALARLGYLNKAIGEMKAAAKLIPDDENIKKDIYAMERAWEQNPDSD